MVKDYPQLTLRVPPATHAKLHALSAVRKQPRWRVVLDAIDHYFSQQQEINRATSRDRPRVASRRSST